MKIDRPRSSNKKWMIAGVLVLLLVGAYVIMNRQSLLGSQNQPGNVGSVDRAINYDKPTDEQIDLGNDTKKQAIENDGNGDSNSTNVNITITASSVSGNTLRIRTLIANLTSKGACVLTLTNSNSTNESITEKAETQSLPNSSTCKGFDIDMARLASSDLWTISIVYTGTGTSRGEVTKKINLADQG